MGLTTKEIGSSSFNDMISSVDRRSEYVENRANANVTLNNFLTPYTLDNKSSILNAPCGYSNGTYASLRPVQTFGPELVTNGDFSDGTNNWSASNSTLSLDNGYLKITSTGGNRPQANQSVSGLTIGKKYKLSAEAKRGTCLSQVEIEISGIGSTVNTNKNNTTEFKNIFYEFTATSTTQTIQAKIDDGSSTVGETAFFKIVNLKEIQDADFDFSRGSSATRVNEKGLIEDVASGIPRIDYTSGQGALLLEPQSTNLVTYSEDLTQGLLNRILITSNVGTSPNGTNNADKLIPNNTNSAYHYFAFSSLTIATNNVYSVFLKKAEYQYALISFETSGTSGSSDKALINLNNGTIEQSDTETKVENYGNGWYRCSIKATSSRTSVAIYPLPSAGLGSFTGDNASGILAWGVQAEQKSFATSYIKTEGSTVTRSADVANNSGNADLINSTEGVLYAEIAALADDATNRKIAIGTSSNRIIFGYKNSSNQIRVEVISSGSVVFDNSQTIDDVTTFSKFAIKYKQNDFALWMNGEEIAIDTSGNPPIGLSELAFDDGGSNNFYGKTKELAVFKEALTDEELAQITSATQQEVFYEMRDRMNIKNYDYYEFGDYTTRLKKLF